MEVGGPREIVGPQQGLEIAPGAPHQARNDSPAPVEFVVVSMPPSHGDCVSG